MLNNKRYLLRLLITIFVLCSFSVSLIIMAQSDGFSPIAFPAENDPSALSERFTYADYGNSGNQLILNDDGSMTLIGAPETKVYRSSVEMDGAEVATTFTGDVDIDVNVTLNGPYSIPESPEGTIGIPPDETAVIGIRIPGEELAVGFVEFIHIGDNIFLLNVEQQEFWRDNEPLYSSEFSGRIEGDTQKVRLSRVGNEIIFQVYADNRWIPMYILDWEYDDLPEELELIFFTFSGTDDESSATFSDLGIRQYVPVSPTATPTPEPRTTYRIGLSVVVPPIWEQELIDSRFPFGDAVPQLRSYPTLKLTQRNFGQVLFTRVDAGISNYGIQNRGQFMDTIFGNGNYGPITYVNESILPSGFVGVQQVDVFDVPDGFQYRVYYVEFISLGIYHYVVEVVAPESTFDEVNLEAIRMLGSVRLQN